MHITLCVFFIFVFVSCGTLQGVFKGICIRVCPVSSFWYSNTFMTWLEVSDLLVALLVVLCSWVSLVFFFSFVDLLIIVLLKGRIMGPILPLVTIILGKCNCYHGYMQKCAFLCISDNFLSNNINVFFLLKKQNQNLKIALIWRKEKELFLAHVSHFFSYQWKETKIPSADILRT